MKNNYFNINIFIHEIYKKLRISKRDINEPWFLIKDFDSLNNLDYDKIEDFISIFNFIKKEQYKYISINKIQFIIESLKFLKFDIIELSKILNYQGFEQLIKKILTLEGYNVINNYRFSDKSYFKYETNQTKYEIDVIGLKNNILLIIDAKQYNKKDSYSFLNKAARLQYRRVIALKKNKEILYSLIYKLTKYPEVLRKKLPIKIIPVIITLEDCGFKISLNNLPLVSIYKLKSFLRELKFNYNIFNYKKINKLNFQKQLL
ncbi:MAG: hypothetical protein JXA99_11745 [Candidatus Lokiarchaeota archaeon]|nr:hypothetical protein [Candidatus Lokiarchaeota archaeon]